MKYVAHLNDNKTGILAFEVFPENGEVTYLGAGSQLFDTLVEVQAAWPGVPISAQNSGDLTAP